MWFLSNFPLVSTFHNIPLYNISSLIISFHNKKQCSFIGSPTSDLDLCVVVHPALAPLTPSSSTTVTSSSSQLHGLADVLKAKLGIAGGGVDGSGSNGDDVVTGVVASVTEESLSIATSTMRHDMPPIPPQDQITSSHVPITSSTTIATVSSSTSSIISDSQRVLELHGNVSYTAQTDIINKIHTYIVNTPSGDSPRV